MAGGRRTVPPTSSWQRIEPDATLCGAITHHERVRPRRLIYLSFTVRMRTWHLSITSGVRTNTMLWFVIRQPRRLGSPSQAPAPFFHDFAATFVFFCSSKDPFVADTTAPCLSPLAQSPQPHLPVLGSATYPT